MPDEDLARVGQGVIDTIVSVYLPDGDDTLTLAIHPGQAIAENVVQSGRTGPESNPLVLSEWIADQYDYPLLLKRSEGTSVVSSLSGGVTGKTGYAAMVPWATPSLPADSPAYARVSSLISTARQSLGSNPEVLPFGCEPDDFAEPDSSGWHVFDTTVAHSHTETTTETPSSGVRADPRLWRMRALPPSVVEVLPARKEVHRASTELLRNSVKEIDFSQVTSPLVLDKALLQQNLEHVAIQQEVAPLIMAPLESAVEVSPLLATTRNLFSLKNSVSAEVIQQHIAQAQPAPQPTSAVSRPTLDIQSYLASDALTLVQTEDLASAPSVTQTTTEASELHVHFEYQLLRITRRLAGDRWWREELITDSNWYVPGMRKGDMFNSPEGDVTLYMPQALIVVRNVSITGSWTDEARATLRNGITYIGPFLVAPASETDTSTSSGAAFSILGAGIQVIGELCSPLPSLPPVDDPALQPGTPG
jgi:hypothetical protein